MYKYQIRIICHSHYNSPFPNKLVLSNHRYTQKKNQFTLRNYQCQSQYTLYTINSLQIKLITHCTQINRRRSVRRGSAYKQQKKGYNVINILNNGLTVDFQAHEKLDRGTSIRRCDCSFVWLARIDGLYRGESPLIVDVKKENMLLVLAIKDNDL